MIYRQIHPLDNVAVLLKAEGSIPAGHKVALRAIKKGEPVIKYGDPIGRAVCDIAVGEHVHSHNLHTALRAHEAYDYVPGTAWPLPSREERAFQGFVRSDGRVGIRNEIWILPMVGCVGAVARQIERAASSLNLGAVEGVYAFEHPYGCSQLGDDLENTRRLLAALAAHPNAAGVLILALGCENNTLDDFKAALGAWDEARVKFLVCQDCEDEVAEGVSLIEEIIEAAASDRRQAVPASKMCVGLKCGGSDGFSGITANPLVGAFSDWLIAQGGTSLLTEVPEMFGAERILMNRCVDRATFDKTVELIESFKGYFVAHNQPVYENPSPGNKAGGITTLEEKSLGCTQKGGHAPVVDVLSYAERVHRPGLNLLWSPGNDLVSATALAASGAQLVLFTTGRGTPFGCPVPTVKIATNTALFEKKPLWMDFNAGSLLDGEDMSALAARLEDYVLSLASGVVKTRAEEHGVRGICLFKSGVTL